MKCTVCIIDEDPVIRAGCSLLIDQTPGFRVVGAFGTGQDALLHCEACPPDVVLLDVAMTGLDGPACIRNIVQRAHRTRVLVFSACNDPEVVFRAFRAGAGGYLTKNIRPAQLLEAIREIKEGGAPMSAPVARMIVASFHKNLYSPLSARETEVMVGISKGKSAAGVADQLFIGRETVRTHIKNIYGKLGVRSKSAAIAKALREKLI